MGMHVAVSSVAGDPRNPRTWSNAPANLIGALEAIGHTVTGIDSSRLSWLNKAAMGARNTVQGLPWNVVSWFEPARRKRARHVVETARAAKCDFIICAGTLDAPIGLGLNYAVWLDNTFALLQRSAVALPFSLATVAEIERLERLALQGARVVLTFSEHVQESVIMDYGVPSNRVQVVGCGSGPLAAFEGEKSFADGHLLFVAKHLFSEKGGDLLLEAFQIIRRVRPETRLVLIGNDEARSKAEGMEGVEVHGYINRDVLDAFYYGASMLVQPMLADPWGQVYLEAMKARAVVVGLNVGAMAELTDRGRLGILLERADPVALAGAVLATFARPQRELDAITWEAQKRVLSRFEWPSVADRVLQALAHAGCYVGSTSSCECSS